VAQAEAPTELIQKVPLFADLDKNELDMLTRSFKERTFQAGQTVAEEGSGGVGFFVIADGTAKVVVHGQERGTLGPGDYFGEIALIDEGARSATITAESDLRCYGLTSWEFRPLVEMNASIAWKLLQAMAKQLRAAEQRES
jgi:CRP-like cAMP-binding protein